MTHSANFAFLFTLFFSEYSSYIKGTPIVIRMSYTLLTFTYWSYQGTVDASKVGSLSL